MTPEPAAVAETHSAVVFFVGDRAYKIKKPLDLGFLDFSTREQREAVCHREVALNRRLAPDVYLGVADVLDPNGTPCDHLVVMRRMPGDRRLSTMVRAGADVDDDLRAVARTVAGFHAPADRSAAIDDAASADALISKWEVNAEVLARFAGAVVPAPALERSREVARGYIAGRGPLLARRIAEGCARDGHGDLLTDDIFCLDDGPRILDCLEFDDRLRFGDVLADAAFLAMDLERLGRHDLAERFMAWWSEFGGGSHPRSLADHYVAYRAQVRTKVGCLRVEQGDEQAGVEARRLLDLCLAHLERGRVRLVVVGGLPGTGKSTLAAGLSDALGLAVFRSDEIRKELAGVGPDDTARAGYHSGIYSPAHTARTYEAMLERAADALGQGESVVLDASWIDRRWRERAAEVAAATHSDLVELRCEAPVDEAARRMAERTRAGRDPSDATPAVASAMAATADAWSTASAIDTGRSVEEALSAARAIVESPAAPSMSTYDGVGR
jgi:aminoglycoside phosphotransferase family enzyme/predicted kinase